MGVNPILRYYFRERGGLRVWIGGVDVCGFKILYLPL
jgi:hypothetical protein